MSYNIKQGEDLIVELVVIDENNQKVDLTTATKIRVGFTIKGTIVKKYIDTDKETIISGYGVVSVNSVNSSQLDILVKRSHTSTFPIGNISATVLIEFPDVDLTTKTIEYTYIIGVVEAGILKEEDLSI